MEQKRRITFADVAGQDQAKREVSELVDFLRDPERFEKVGAEVPHGVLLMGPPGTGKTLLARALAGEAEVPFFSTSGSEFIEVFVGVGAGRRAAEKLLLGSLSSGADDDIRRATELARSMVARWGMNAEIGPVDLRESEDHPFLGQTIAQPRTFSDATAARVDAAVADLLCDPEAEASRLIESHRNQVARLVERLEAEESLDAAAIRACLAPDDKVTPLLANSRRAEPELGAGD